jgi:ribosomal protein L32
MSALVKVEVKLVTAYVCNEGGAQALQHQVSKYDVRYPAGVLTPAIT